MKEKRSFIFFWFLVLLLTQCGGTSGNNESQKKEISKQSDIDLSTPNKTISYFFEAFRTGNKKLLNKVLEIDPNAAFPEIDPIEPRPYIAGVEINEINIIKEGKTYPNGFVIKPSDVEVYVTIKYDPMYLKYQGVPNGRVAFLLRKIDNKWKIISAIPFWPEEERSN